MSDRLEAIAEAADDGHKVGVEPDTGAGQCGDAIEAPLAHVRDWGCLDGAKEARNEAARVWREHLRWRRDECFEGAEHHMVTRLAVDDIELPADRSEGRPLDVGHRPFGRLGWGRVQRLCRRRRRRRWRWPRPLRRRRGIGGGGGRTCLGRMEVRVYGA